VQVVAKAEGYDLVLDRATGSVFYWKDDADLTQKIVDRLNADFGGSAAPSAPAK
jgi:Skp family chaperone for outer membrane proteins